MLPINGAKSQICINGRYSMAIIFSYWTLLKLYTVKSIYSMSITMPNHHNGHLYISPSIPDDNISWSPRKRTVLVDCHNANSEEYH